jgi:carboxymethylenebutenolidase
MSIRTEWVALAVADGTGSESNAMKAYVARPEGKPRAALLVMQEAFGVNSHIRDVTERFAREGYLSIAPELFHRTGQGLEFGYDDFSKVGPHFMALTNEGQEADIRAAYDWIANSSGESGLKVCSIGYCMGGRTSFMANLILPLSCAISYYGGGIAPSPYFPALLGREAELHGPTMLVWGGMDKGLPREATRQVEDALIAAGKPYVNITFSYADHGFFCDARAQYNATAAAEAWPLTLGFLKTHTS